MNADVRGLTTWGSGAPGDFTALPGLPVMSVAGTFDNSDGQAWPPPGEPDALAAVTPAAPDDLTGR